MRYRFCSASCVTNWRAKNLSAGTVAADDRRHTFEIVGLAPESSQELAVSQDSTDTTELMSSQSSEATLPPDSPVGVDSYGIPIDVHHFRDLVNAITCGTWHMYSQLPMRWVMMMMLIDSPIYAFYVRQPPPARQTTPEMRV